MTNKRFASHLAALFALAALAIVPANALHLPSEALSKSDLRSKQLQAQLVGDIDRFRNVVGISAHTTAPIAGSLEITEIKNAGVSAARETHSIVQVSWATPSTFDGKISSFELLLEVTYADGFVEKAPAKSPGSARTTRFEVPTLHRRPNQPAAEMKSFRISITANSSETTTKQISL